MKSLSDEEIEKQSNELDKSVRATRTEKRGRPKKRKTGKYTMSPRALVQRQVSWAKALEHMPVGNKRGSNKKKITDGFQHMTKLKELTNCEKCACKAYCSVYPTIDEDKPESMTKCPLWLTYRKSIIDVIGNPLSYLAQKAGALDLAIAKQQMKDQSEGVIISKEMLAATKLAMEAVKIAQKEERNGKGKSKVMDAKSINEEVVDADFSIPGE